MYWVGFRTGLALELAPRWFAGGHLNDSAAHAPDVGLPAMTSLLDDFGRHPVGGPLHALVA